jgi:hypothetical protein
MAAHWANEPARYESVGAAVGTIVRTEGVPALW